MVADPQQVDELAVVSHRRYVSLKASMVFTLPYTKAAYILYPIFYININWIHHDTVIFIISRNGNIILLVDVCIQRLFEISANSTTAITPLTKELKY